MVWFGVGNIMNLITKILTATALTLLIAGNTSAKTDLIVTDLEHKEKIYMVCSLVIAILNANLERTFEEIYRLNDEIIEGEHKEVEYKYTISVDVDSVDMNVYGTPEKLPPPAIKKWNDLISHYAVMTTLAYNTTLDIEFYETVRDLEGSCLLVTRGFEALSYNEVIKE